MNEYIIEYISEIYDKNIDYIPKMNIINNTLNNDDIIKFNKKVMKKNKVKYNQYKEDTINLLLSWFEKNIKESDCKLNDFNIISDYKENTNYYIKKFDNAERINIIFKPKNFERLLLSNNTYTFILIDINKFNEEINLLNKYFTNINKQIIILTDNYYFITGKIWLFFLTVNTVKFVETKINNIYPQLYSYISYLTCYLNYLYMIIRKHNYKLKKILEDKEAIVIIKKFGMDKYLK